ncbi:2-dehydropantoate 2-reductase [Oceaniserpentilla sp. 4NH20-0058]|uniref:ketopantoate reductase family protein n=1 Tax=Oceaniserpentilla sp. 4NH20-0058 TaxID=3127660 RepID=UPI00310B5A24
MSNVYILGSGAMGCLWASYLSQYHNVSFIKRRAIGEQYEFTYQPNNKLIRCMCYDAKTLSRPINRLILATKAYDALDALKPITHLLAEHTEIVLLQNGLGSQQEIVKHFPHLTIYACSSTEGAYKPDEHTLVHAGHGLNKIGALTQSANFQSLQSWIPNQFILWQDSIEAILWQKFMINCAINPLTVIYQCANGQLLKNSDYHQHLKKICVEIDIITTAKGYQLTSAYELARKVCEVTAENFSSMLQDARNHRHTEIEYMTGYLLKESARLKLECPNNQTLYSAIQQA